MPHGYGISVGSGSVRAGLDTNIIPFGERALRGVLDHVIAVGDEAESTYLEVKSTLDMKARPPQPRSRSSFWAQPIGVRTKPPGTSVGTRYW